MLRIWKTFVYENYFFHGPKSKQFFFKAAVTSCTVGGGVAFYIGSTTDVESKLTEDNVVATSDYNTHFAITGAAIRFLRSVSIGIRISIDYWITNRTLNPKCPEYAKEISMLHRRNAERILHGCLINGGTYIKIGQGLVSLSHILPEEYISTLTWLQDSCRYREEGELYEIFLEEFGKTPTEIFKTFEPHPIAAASLAQVFVATTKLGEKVAVKVQYKDLQERFGSDVSTIHFLLKMCKLFHPNFDFDWILRDLTDSLRKELDFHNEGKNAERCANDLKHLKYIYVPKVYWEFCSQRVLVTEFIDGIKINDKEKLLKEGHSLKDVDKKMFHAFGEQIFQNGFVHADPHPGNVFVRKANNQTQLVLLDHGLYQELTTEERNNLSKFWQAIVTKDYQKMNLYSKKLGVQEYRELAEVLTQTPMTREFKLVTRLTQEELNYFADMARSRFNIITKTLKDMPRSLLFVTRNLNTLRSIAHDHGDPVNRYTILARVATRTAFKATDSFWKKIAALPTRIEFEYQILMQKFWINFMSTYFKILEWIGRSPNPEALITMIS